MTRQHNSPQNQVIAYFISAHGYGHGARGVSVMAALHKLNPTIRFEIFTQVPRHLFEESFAGEFGYHELLTDIGVVQSSSLTENLSETVRQLDDFLPFEPRLVKNLAQQLTDLNCSLVMCDIAPLGIAVANEAGIPSVLVENFTWDWIYEGYRQHEPGLQRHASYLRSVFDSVDYRIQTEPLCQRRPADLYLTTPIGRTFQTPRHQTRQRLGIPDQSKVVLITLGGIRGRYPFLEQLQSQNGLCFVIPGADDQRRTADNLLLLPHNSDFFHPDLINAADVVIGKAGYSTIAEVYQAGVPFGYVARQKFPESETLIRYIDQQMRGLRISEAQFQDGSWLSLLPELLAMPRLDGQRPNGAEAVARFVLEKLA